MKVSASIRRLHEDQEAISERLKPNVDKRIAGFKNPRWHYESRIKDLQGFALKLESGRFAKPQAMEDFFASTIVVRNAAEIDAAEHLIKTNFALEERARRIAAKLINHLTRFHSMI